MQKIDVAISYYGKPYQTMVTLFSLLEQSNNYIDKIYLCIEKKQPYEDAWQGIPKIKEIFEKRGVIIVHLDKFVPWMANVSPQGLDETTRLSLRYQYALEKTNKKYLLICHNDMLYHKDLIHPMIQVFERNPGENLVGVGRIGQCWNCSAFYAKLCTPEKFEDYKPSQQELLEQLEQYPTPRYKRSRELVSEGFVHPLPECRLNEYACLVNVDLYRKTTIPNGPVPYFGGVWNGSDTAAAWFRDSYLNGLRFENLYYEDYADHAPFSSVSNGNDADNNRVIYEDIEQQARDYMIKHYHADQYSASTQLRIAKMLGKRKLQKIYNKVLNRL
ncbi:hypothetical protein BWI96_18630 [Siphonobacter sp. SORGH_AS_0500]|uniref:hypothetical protein n=1 Tax=Siphonobacter sp. SORGH_AS_0500 TaxID=1864824 RepID=UPI000CBCCC43|nr:hypothetical protein [Siphonobacter sp. SORGH_AS_0500]PKK35072.1 hypothetical protein BWI96_18630 [Siphonobacter sp. SORGH_AS_0500]